MNGLRKAISIFMCALREIFDEAAYSRYLQRTQKVSSRAAYAAFWRERESASPRKVSCC